MSTHAPESPASGGTSLAEGKALLARSRILGRVSAFIFLLAALAIVDALQTLMRHEFNSIDLVPGESVLVSGMLPVDVKTLEGLEVVIDGDPGVTFTPIETYKGFWMGGHMWRAELSAAPDAKPGHVSLTIVDIIKEAGDTKNFDDRDRSILFGGQQNPALVFGVTLWASESDRQRNDISLVRRFTGLPAFGLAAVCVLLGIAAGMGNWLVFSRAETALAAHGVFFIHGLKNIEAFDKKGRPVTGEGPPGYKAAFARAGRGFAIGDQVVLYDRDWREQSNGRIVEVDRIKAFALFSHDGVRPKYGWLVARAATE